MAFSTKDDLHVITVDWPSASRSSLPLDQGPIGSLLPWSLVSPLNRAAFKRPVRLINDPAAQALGSCRGGAPLFLGLGTGLGSALMVRSHIAPLELGQLSCRRGIAEDHLRMRGLTRLGQKRWLHIVAACVEHLIPALQLDDVVLGGGNVRNLSTLPACCRTGDNANAFVGGL